MAKRRRGGREARREESEAAAARGAGFRQPVYAYDPVAILSEDRVEAIHLASLKILSEYGIRILLPQAREILCAEGAELDGDDIVKFDPAMVMEKIALAPNEFALEARNPAKSVRLGGRHAVFSAVGGPAFVEDMDRGRRAGTYAEMCDFLRLIQGLDVLHQEAGGPFEALDIHQSKRHLHLHYAQATLLDKNWQPYGLGRVRARDGLEMAAILYGCTREALKDRVVFTCVINTNSPLMLDVAMAEGVIEMARHGQANVITPFTLAGAMSPVTLAGALAQQNAEALAGIVLAECVRPGVPVVYGGFTTNVDMRTGAPAFGTPEYTQAAQISGQLARRYNIPFRSSNVTTANTCDAQAAYESQMALWGAINGQAHLVKHAAGWLGGGLTASFEKLMIDAEMLQMIAAYLVPPEVDQDTLAHGAIGEVGHGGHFFGTAHTLERYQTAFYEPLVSNWDNYENWCDNGSETVAERANAVWKQRLEAHEDPALDPAIEEALRDYVARREREIDAGVNVPAT